MNAAETSASSAIADCTPLAVVWRSWTTAEIDTFITDVSTTSTNIAIDSRTESRPLPDRLMDVVEAIGTGGGTIGCVKLLALPAHLGMTGASMGASYGRVPSSS